ncbi:hypothetical protein ACLB2K_008305 [Fragaria x ananassa]
MDEIELVTRSLVHVLRRSESLSQTSALWGIKCLSHLFITIRNHWSHNWSAAAFSALYGCLLCFVTYHNYEVREQQWSCLREVLRSLQGTMLIDPASEAITELFKKWFPCGEPIANVFFLMSTKYKLAILNDFKIILELLRSPVTTSIGVAKIYSSNRQLCVMKLPVVFNALKAIMGQTSWKDIQGYDSEPDVEHQHSAAFSFKCLIHACIDKALIKEGVDQIVIHSNINIDANKSHQPSIIAQVCAIIESLLGYQYTAIWDLAFEIVSTMFDKLGGYSSYFMKGTLNCLAGMQKLTKKEFRKQMHECLGSALVAMGPEKFLGLLPLNLEAEDPSEVNDWLFPILTKYTVGARLSFFTNSILVMVGIMREKSQKLRLQGHSSRRTDALVNSLWSLLPSFCNFPSDTNESFKDLEHALCNALLREPEIGGIICSSLQVLIRQNKGTTEEANDLSTNNVSIAEQRALASYTPQVTAENLRVLRQSASHFLSVLSAVFLENRDYEGNLLQSTIGEFASISNTEVVSVLFNNTMEKLSEVTLDANKAESSIRTCLLDLAVSLLPGLNSGEVDNLFTATKLALQDNEILIQRKAYKVLSIVFKKCHTFTSWKIEEWHRLMMEVLPSCHSLAKEHRLECLHLLVVQVLKSNTEQRWPEITRSFLAEIIHALKETNKRTRDRAFDILVQIGHACGDAERGGTREHRHKFFDMVAEGLACRTPSIELKSIVAHEKRDQRDKEIGERDS